VAQNYTFVKIQHGGHHLEFDFCHISVVNEVIFVKFGTLIDIGQTRVTVSNYPTSDKIQDGGGRHLKFGFLGISRSQ